MTPNVPIEGGCLCRQVRFRSLQPPILARACWCRVCQYLASGNATINVVFAADGLTITGQTQDYLSRADSGSHMHRRFCPVCGTQVFSAAEERPNLIVVRAGTLDDPSIAAPQGTIWTASAPPWARIDLERPHYTGQPPAVSALHLSPSTGTAPTN